MKKVFALLCVCTLAIASVGVVGCGGAPDNSTQKTNTAGQKAPKNTDAENQGGKDKGKDITGAGGEAKADTPPD